MTTKPLWTRLAWPLLIVQGGALFLVWLAASRSPAMLAWLTGALMISGCVTIVVLRRHAATLRAVARAAERVTQSDDQGANGSGGGGGGDEGMDRLPRQTSDELAALAEAVKSMSMRHAERLDLLRAQRNEQEAILQSMDGALIALDPLQRILSLNRSAERMLGVAAGATQGRLIQETVREPELNDFINAALAEPGTLVDEIRLLSHGPRVVRANSARLLDGQGEPVGIIILLTDITELRRLEQVRSDFAANVSHELRTPITNIKGYTETLLDSFEANPKLTHQFLQTIKRNADQMDAIVEDMLLLTRIERPGAESQLAATPTPARTVISAARARVEPESVSKRIAIEVGGEADLSMMVNPRLAESALFNLLANAVKYSPAGTRVRVSVAPTTLDDHAPGVEIEVADEGPGIAPEHLPRLWERFYRVDKARSREQGGTGLGLSIVRHIALVHGGRVSVVSTPGLGSRFRVAFPASGSAPHRDPKGDSGES